MQGALAFEAYAQFANVSATNVADVGEPTKDCEETACMFDTEHEDVMLVEESEAFGIYLLTGAKETGTDHHVLEAVKASRSLAMAWDWKAAPSRKQRNLQDRVEFVNLISEFRWKSQEWERAVRLISIFSETLRVCVDR